MRVIPSLIHLKEEENEDEDDVQEKDNEHDEHDRPQSHREDAPPPPIPLAPIGAWLQYRRENQPAVEPIDGIHAQEEHGSQIQPSLDEPSRLPGSSCKHNRESM